MDRQLFFEDVSEGMDVPPQTRDTSYAQSVAYAGASRDHYAIHLDRETAKAAGLPDVVIHGALKAALLAQLVTRWMGEWGTLKSLDVEFRGIDVPGPPLTARGLVVRKYTDGGQSLVECQLWLENLTGTRTTRGRAVLALPSRAEAFYAQSSALADRRVRIRTRDSAERES